MVNLEKGRTDMKTKKHQPTLLSTSGGYIKKEMKQSKLLFLINMGSVLCLVAIFAALITTVIQSHKADNLNHNRFLLTECATHFIDASFFLTTEVRSYASTGDEIHYNNYMNELEQNKTREQAIATMKEIGITAEEQAHIDEMMRLSNELVPLEKQAIAEVDHSVSITRTMELNTACLILFIIFLQILCFIISHKRVITPLIALEKEIGNLAQGKLSEPFPYQPNTSEMGRMIESIITMRRNLKEYISDITEKLTRMAAKDMTVQVAIDYIGDFTPIKHSLNTIIASMNEVLCHINQAADEVAEESTRLAQGAQNLATGTMQQANAITEVSNSMGKLSEQVEHTADQAKMASSLAQAAGVKLGKSNEHLQDMLQAMREISDSSGEISKVVKTIEEIAFQTNLLALNAAVEAARAGTAGKGFAVVAGEVRALANKSATASQNTSAMIENSLETIKNGAEIAQEASDTFVEVIINAGKAANAMDEITVSTKKQFEVFEKLTEHVEQIASVVQGHSSVSEESARISKQLDFETEDLRDMVAQFHLKKTAQ